MFTMHHVLEMLKRIFL